MLAQALVSDQGFQHIIRVLNTNVDGRQKVMFAITAIKGIGRRLSNVACKKAEVDLAKRAGELSASELESLMVVVSNPRQFRVPDWFLNRKKDIKDGRFTQASRDCAWQPGSREMLSSRPRRAANRRGRVYTQA